jgi:hypothetical protein
MQLVEEARLLRSGLLRRRLLLVGGHIGIRGQSAIRNTDLAIEANLFGTQLPDMAVFPIEIADLYPETYDRDQNQKDIQGFHGLRGNHGISSVRRR